MRHAASLLLAVFAVACGSSSPPSTTASTTAKSQVAVAPAPTEPHPEAADFAGKLTPWIQSIGAKWGEAKQFSGYVHVTKGDKVLYSRAFGYADRAAKRAATADTNFRIGSVTKQFTAAAILLLEQEGKLSTSDPISKHIPEYPAAQAKVTIHQLLNHTGGIPSYTEVKSVMDKRHQAITPKQLMEVTWNKPLEFEPGTKWNYSNSGYVVLGVIIERASGMPYAEFMHKRLFAPAGLTRTVVGDAEGMSDRAEGYELKDGALVPANKIHMSTPYAAGAIRSTANDLVRWHMALTGTGLLTEASKKKLYTPDKNDYAYGWMVKNKDGKTVIGHGGGIDGFLTDYVRAIEDDLVVVVWNNAMNGSPAKVRKAAVTIAFGGTPEPVKQTAPGKADPTLLARCAGTYAMDEASQAKLRALVPAAVDKVKTIAVSVKAGHLFLKPNGLPGIAVRPTATGDFQSDVGGVTFVCKPEDGKPAAEVRLKQGPFDSRLTRMP